MRLLLSICARMNLLHGSGSYILRDRPLPLCLREVVLLVVIAVLEMVRMIRTDCTAIIGAEHVIRGPHVGTFMVILISQFLASFNAVLLLVTMV